MKSLQTLMAGIDQRIKANAERAQAEQGALQFEAEPEAPPRIEDTADQAQPPKARAKSSHLVPHRHRQGDFFIADILDAIPKGDVASMEHPLFALKAGDMRVRVYGRNGATVTIKPGHDGCATIHDKDVWIYCISQLVEAMNRGREDVSRIVRFTAYDFLVSTNRRTDGDSYNRMAEAMGRLRRRVVVRQVRRLPPAFLPPFSFSGRDRFQPLQSLLQVRRRLEGFKPYFGQ